MSEHRVRHVPPLHAPPVPRAREDVAAIRAASFAATDHAAGALLAMTVQQRLTTPEWLSTASQMHPTLRRRRAIAGFIRDIGGGSQSIDELAFVAHPRRRRSPLPDRQVVRQGPDGGWYLDARWNAAGLVTEIDGAHHQGSANRSPTHCGRPPSPSTAIASCAFPTSACAATLMRSSTRSKPHSSTQGLWRFVLHEAPTSTTPGVA